MRRAGDAKITRAEISPKTVSKDDKTVLENLERDLKRVVFGQDEAITALASAIKLSRAGLKAPDKPVGSFVFAGPTGVGKTEVTKQLAKLLGVIVFSTCANTSTIRDHIEELLVLVSSGTVCAIFSLISLE